MNFWRLLNARIRTGRGRVLAMTCAVAAATAIALVGMAESLAANPAWESPAGLGGALILVTAAAYGQIWAGIRIGRWTAGVSRQIRRSIIGSYVALEPPAAAEIDRDAARDALVGVPRGLAAVEAEAPAAAQSFLSSLACIVVTLLIDPVAGAALLLTLKLGAIGVTALIVRARGGKTVAHSDDIGVGHALSETFGGLRRSLLAASGPSDAPEARVEAAMRARRAQRAGGLGWTAAELAAGAAGRPMLAALLVAVTRLAGEPPDRAAAMLLIAFLIPLDWIAAVPRLAALSSAADRLAAFEAALRAAGRRWPPPTEPPGGAFRSLELQGAMFHYPAAPGRPGAIVGPVSCRAATGQLLFVSGGSGAGKTSVLAMLAGLAAPEAGQVLRNGSAIDPRRIRDTAAFVAADPVLFNGLRVAEPERTLVRWLIEELDLGGLPGIRGGHVPDPAALPRAVRSRVALLLAIAGGRPLILLDEWDARQGMVMRERFYGAILPRLRESGRAVVVATGDRRYEHMADEVVRLEHGRQASRTDPLG